jgi:MFS family permease
MQKQKTSFFPLLVWVLAALFYLYELFLRVFVATISDEVMTDLHLDAQKFAAMGAGYYLIYSLMQLPVGVLADRFGPRTLLTIATFLAGIGGLWFAFVEGFSSGFLSRCFMGFGSSFAYVCLLVLTLNWFPRDHFGLMVGVASLLGALGPILAGGPLSVLLNLCNNNWRLVVGFIGLFGLGLAILIGIFLRNAPPRAEGDIIHLDPSKETLRSRFKTLIQNKQVWATTIYSGFVYVCLPLLGAYWGTSYLKSIGFSRTEAALIVSMLWIGMGIGGPLLGKYSDKIKRRKTPLSICAFLGMIVTICVVYLPIHSKWTYMVLFALIGFASAVQGVAFALVTEHVPAKLRATAIGTNNTMIMLFAAIFPPIVSYFIGKSAALHHETAGTFMQADFESGFFLMPLFYLFAYLISAFFIQETYCRQQFEVVKIDKGQLK